MSKHLAEKTLKLMTVKEVSGVLGRDQRTVQLKVKELFPEIVKNGKATYLTEKQVTLIKLELEKKFEVKTNLKKELLIQQAMMFQQEKIENMQNELAAANKTIELNAPKVKLAEDSIRDKDKHYSITNAGKQLGLKQTFIFNLMREKHLLTVDKLPTQSALNRKMLTLRTNIVAGKNRPQAVMTMENIYNFKNVYEKDFI